MNTRNIYTTISKLTPSYRKQVFFSSSHASVLLIRLSTIAGKRNTLSSLVVHETVKCQRQISIHESNTWNFGYSYSSSFSTFQINVTTSPNTVPSIILKFHVCITSENKLNNRPGTYQCAYEGIHE